MRKVLISDTVQDKIVELNRFLTQEYFMSQSAADARTRRMQNFVASLSAPISHALCRSMRWRELGYRCTSFEGWVFAYELFDDGIIIRDMKHSKLIFDTVN
jgi:hypothetical protein